MQVLKLKFSTVLQKSISIILMLMLSTNAFATDSIYTHKMKRLQGNSTESLAGLSTKPKVVVVYQPHCKWCEKQISDLAQFQHHCDGAFNTILVGSKGNKRKLLSELKRFNGDFPAFAGSRKFLKGIGGVPATPITLFFNNKGELIGKNRGYIENDRMQRALAIQTNNKCKGIDDIVKLSTIFQVMR